MPDGTHDDTTTAKNRIVNLSYFPNFLQKYNFSFKKAKESHKLSRFFAKTSLNSMF
jgi:hypothetical protein